MTVLAPFANVQFEQLCTSTAFSKRSMWQALEHMQLLHELSWRPKHCAGSTERRCHCLPEPLARPDPGQNSSCYDIYAHVTSCTIIKDGSSKTPSCNGDKAPKLSRDDSGAVTPFSAQHNFVAEVFQTPQSCRQSKLAGSNCAETR